MMGAFGKLEKTKVILVLSIAFIALLSPVVDPYNQTRFYDILLGIGISIILAEGLNLVNGYTGQFSLGHAGFMAVGAFLGSAMSLGIVFPYLDGPTWAGVDWTVIFKILQQGFAWIVNLLFWVHNGLIGMSSGLPGWAKFLMALIYGGATAALSGFLVGVPSLRLKGDYLAIVTLGFNEIIRVVIQNAEPLGAQRGLTGVPSNTNFFWVFSFTVLTIYVVHNLVHSTYGRGFLAVRDDEIAAESMGINTTKYKVLAFVVGAAFAGIAGTLFAHQKQYINPESFNFIRSVDIVVMVILGGMGNTVGVCIAAALLTILPEILRDLAKVQWLPEWFRHIAENRMIIYSLLLIILMLARPQGLFGGWGKKKGEA